MRIWSLSMPSLGCAALLGFAAGCSSDRGALPGTTQAATSTQVGTTTTCKVTPNEQRAPDAATPERITGIAVNIYPEGVPAIVQEDSDLMTPRQTEALQSARALLPEALPAPLPQSCCASGSYVRINFVNDYVMYGPCDLPPVIDEVRSLVQTATYVKS